MRPRISDNRRWILGKNGEILMGHWLAQMYIDGPADAGPFPWHDGGVRDPDTQDYHRPPYWNSYGQTEAGSWGRVPYDGNNAMQMERWGGKLAGIFVAKMRGWCSGWNGDQPILTPTAIQRLRRYLELCEQYDLYFVLAIPWCTIGHAGWQNSGPTTCTSWQWVDMSIYDGVTNSNCGTQVPVGPATEPSQFMLVKPSPTGNLFARALWNLMTVLYEALMSSPYKDRWLGVVGWNGETETAGYAQQPSVPWTEIWRVFLNFSQAHKEFCYARRDPSGANNDWWRYIRGPGINDGEPAVLDLSFYCESVGSQPGGPELWNDAEFFAEGPQFIGVTNYTGTASILYNFPHHLFDRVLGGDNNGGPGTSTGRLGRAYELGKQAENYGKAANVPAYLGASTLRCAPFRSMPCFRRNPPRPYDGRYGWWCFWYESDYAAVDPNATGCAHPQGQPPGAVCTRLPSNDEVWEACQQLHAQGLDHLIGEADCPAWLHRGYDPNCPRRFPRTADEFRTLLGVNSRVFCLATYLDGGAAAHQWCSPEWDSDELLNASACAKAVAGMLQERWAHAAGTAHDRLVMHEELHLLDNFHATARACGSIFRDNVRQRNYAFIYVCTTYQQASGPSRLRLAGLPHGGAWRWRTYSLTGAAPAQREEGTAEAYMSGGEWNCIIQFQFAPQYDALIILQDWPFEGGGGQQDTIPPEASQPSPAPGATNVPAATPIAITWTDSGGSGVNPSSFRLYIQGPGVDLTLTSGSQGMQITSVPGGWRFSYQVPGGMAAGWWAATSQCSDIAGNAAEYGVGIWRWQVGSSAAPSFLNPSPAPGATNVPPTTWLRIEIYSVGGVDLGSVRVQLNGGAWQVVDSFALLNGNVHVLAEWDPPGSLAENATHTVAWKARTVNGPEATYGPYSFQTGWVDPTDRWPPICLEHYPNPGVSPLTEPPAELRSRWRDFDGTVPSSGILPNSVSLDLDDRSIPTNAIQQIQEANGVWLFRVPWAIIGQLQNGWHRTVWRVSDGAGNWAASEAHWLLLVDPGYPSPLQNFRVASVRPVDGQWSDVLLTWDPVTDPWPHGVLVLQWARLNINDQMPQTLPGPDLETLPQVGAELDGWTVVATHGDLESGRLTVRVRSGFRYFWQGAVWREYSARAPRVLLGKWAGAMEAAGGGEGGRAEGESATAT